MHGAVMHASVVPSAAVLWPVGSQPAPAKQARQHHLAEKGASVRRCRRHRGYRFSNSDTFDRASQRRHSVAGSMAAALWRADDEGLG